MRIALELARPRELPISIVAERRLPSPPSIFAAQRKTENRQLAKRKTTHKKTRRGTLPSRVTDILRTLSSLMSRSVGFRLDDFHVDQDFVPLVKVSRPNVITQAASCGLPTYEYVRQVTHHQTACEKFH
jgi:hypothetical protein